VLRIPARTLLGLFLLAAMCGMPALAQSVGADKSATTAHPYTPEYTKDGHLQLPKNYREWVFLTSGLGMNYGPNAAMSDHIMFDNVFVNPEAYRVFVETGTWPDKTVLMLEVRGAESKGSINKAGHYQSTEKMGVEAHVKDESRFPGKWAFFDFESEQGDLIPPAASCYSCHADHAAVDTTFVQFYPTLLPIAKAKATFSAAYLKEMEAPAK
jgi:Cytochrome P460